MFGTWKSGTETPLNSVLRRHGGISRKHSAASINKAAPGASAHALPAGDTHWVPDTEILNEQAALSCYCENALNT